VAEKAGMKSKTTLSSTLARALPSFTLLVAGMGAWACSAEFQTRCPDGSTQTAGGGDINDACTPNDQLAGAGGTPGAGQGGAPGAGGSPGSSGAGGSVPLPPGAECAPDATKCTSDAQQTCGADGKWGPPAACDITCDAAASKCVVPVQVAVGHSHACALLSNGTVQCWGDDQQGQLGHGPKQSSTKPMAVPGLTDVEKLFVGGAGACAVRKDKTIVCWGANASEQVMPDPSGISEEVRTPVALNAQGVESASVESHICVINSMGASVGLQCKGANTFGKLGNNSEVDSASFVAPIGLPASPVNVSNGGVHTCAALQGGAIYCWGYSSVLGFENSANFLKPKQFAASGFADVVSGGVFACALGTDSTVSCWGANQLGELGRGPSFTGLKSPTPSKVLGAVNIRQVTAGSNHACALKDDGSVACWGYNSYNQLGNTCSQIDCDFDGGLGFSRSPVQVAQLADVERISAGLNSTCALKVDKSVVCWGNNERGQLGNGQLGGSTATPVPVVWK
jgi:alpha-tubulin suppressor-like RCC1 family protein